MEEKKSYLIIKDDNKKPLFIIFGGLMGEIWWNMFEFKNFLSNNIDAHFLFIKDFKQVWYQYGNDELNANTVDDLVIAIQELIRDINYSKIITLGTSMGGFGALLFGSLLQAESIIAFSPQTFIDRPNRQKYSDFRFLKHIRPLNDNHPDKKYFDLINLDFSNSRVDIIYGEDDKLDIIHAARMDIHKFNVLHFPGGHVVIKELRNDGTLLNIILNHINI